jgi:phosphosulfolactate phosphohydrolase-like enzyme
MTVPYAGYYELSFQIVYAANASGYRDIRITKNGTSVLRTLYNVEPTVFTGSIINLGAASDYYQIEVYQNSGGNLNITNDYTYDSHFSINYLGA